MNFISLAYAQESSSAPAGAGAGSFIAFLPMYAMIFIVFYFLLIRPQQKQQQEKENMIASVKKNDEVVTTGGIHGTVVNIKENTIVLKVDENVRIEFNKNAVVSITKSRQ